MDSLAQGIFEKGYVEGEQSGFDKAKKETAIRLHKIGYNKQVILAATQVSEEEVNEWLGLNSDNGEVSGMNLF